MRISDWSSDVCSSDLPFRPVVVNEFSRWANLQLTSAHPEQTPPGCGATDAQKPATSGDMRATVPAAAPELTTAVREAAAHSDRKSVVEGKSVSVRVDHGGRRISKKKSTNSKKS